MKYIIILISTLIISGCTHIPQIETPIQDNTFQAKKQLYVFWDSLTAGYRLPLEESYPMVIEKELQKKWQNIRVINGGESWDTSAGLKERINRISVDAKSWDIALIVIGGNDGLQGLPTNQLAQNLKEIVTLLKAKGLITIIGGMQIPTNLGESYRSDFENIYPSIAQSTQSYLIPFILTGVAGISEFNLPDGIHPNTTGQRIIAQTVIEFLNTNTLLQR